MSGKRVVVLGLAREGVTLARYLCERGAEVTATDSAPEDTLRERLSHLEGLPVEIALGGDYPDLLTVADALFVSPGVPESNPLYREALQRGMPVESMTTLFFDECPGSIVGITGSSGKTTTTGLIGHILRCNERDAVVGGNIGEPMIDLLPDIQAGTIVVLELSSFQLELLRQSPHIAVVTNISPNHLDRHGTMERYVDAKLHIVAHQKASDYAVLNRADVYSDSFALAGAGQVRWFGGGSDHGAVAHQGTISLVRDDDYVPVMPIDEIPLLGRHNVENVLAAITAAELVGISADEMAGAIKSFRPAAHRLQVVGYVHGVSYVDDSIATSPARAQVALDAIQTSILLIAGGRDKRLPWDDVARTIVQRVRVLLLIGEAATLIETAVRKALRLSSGMLLERNIKHCSSLREAVAEAHRLAEAGETVLLSPACTSYDMFPNFEERGREFVRAVEELRAA